MNDYLQRPHILHLSNSQFPIYQWQYFCVAQQFSFQRCVFVLVVFVLCLVPYVFERLFILCTIVATRIIHIDLSDPISTFSNIAFFTLYLFNICRVYMSNNSRIKQDNQR